MPDDMYARALARLDEVDSTDEAAVLNWKDIDSMSRLLRALLEERRSIMAGIYSGPADAALREFAGGE